MSYYKIGFATAAASTVCSYAFERPALNAQALKILGLTVARATTVALVSLRVGMHQNRFDGIRTYVVANVVLTGASMLLMPQVSKTQTVFTAALAAYVALYAAAYI